MFADDAAPVAGTTLVSTTKRKGKGKKSAGSGAEGLFTPFVITLALGFWFVQAICSIAQRHKNH